MRVKLVIVAGTAGEGAQNREQDRDLDRGRCARPEASSPAAFCSAPCAGGPIAPIGPIEPMAPPS